MTTIEIFTELFNRGVTPAEYESFYDKSNAKKTSRYTVNTNYDTKGNTIRGIQAYREGRYDNAKAIWEEVLRNNPTDSQVQKYLENVDAILKRIKE